MRYLLIDNGYKVEMTKEQVDDKLAKNEIYKCKAEHVHVLKDDEIYHKVTT